jgi:hypothetical protein
LSDLKTASKRAADHLRANMNAAQSRPPGVRATVKARAAARTRRPVRSSAARTGGR